jgi:hypothetical protein
MTLPPHEPAALPAATRWRLPRAVSRSRAGTRFPPPTIAVALALYLLVAVSLADVSLNNDSAVYMGFLRRLVGLHSDELVTAQFGSALFALPLFLLARLLDAIGLGSVGGTPVDQLALVAGGVVALVLTVWVAWRLLRRLELPSGAGVIVLTVVGTPLFYYAALLPSYKHAVDALFATLAVYLLFRADDRRGLLALGAAIGFLLTIRSANAAMVPGLLLPFALRRRWRDAGLVLATSIAAVVVLFAIPLARGVQVHNVKVLPHPVLLHDSRLAAATFGPLTLCDRYTWHLSVRQCLHNEFGVWPSGTAPLKMLFTLHRGLFLWTPLTALATVGFVLLLRRRRDLRDVLLGVAVAGLGLLFVHVLWGDFWDAGFSFSQRFLVDLFPLMLLGTAELVRRWGAAAYAALTACAVFSLVLALTFFVGYKGIGSEDGVDTMVKLYTSGERTPQQLVRRVGVDARERWLGH